MTTHKLNDRWVLWFHNPVDNDWSIDSYRQICSINTIEEFWELMSYLNGNHISNSMFFLMRKGIKPIWEDEFNENGGCWSFKISKRDVYKAWIELSIALLGEIITLDAKESCHINGISISPKKAFSIIKIWNRDSKKSNNSMLSKKIPFIFLNSSIYKGHKEKT